MKCKRFLMIMMVGLLTVLVGLTPLTASASSQQVTSENATKAQLEDHLRKPINWHESSETIPYPDLSKVHDLWVKVSIKGNRTYLYDGNHLLYIMYSSAGVYKRDKQTHQLKSLTPTGTFHVQEERGDSFYNASVKTGAKHYVSWHGHGEYLFHSVPTDPDGSFDKAQAAKLGKSTASHGCVRLSIADAKWMEQNLPTGTKVQVVNQ